MRIFALLLALLLVFTTGVMAGDVPPGGFGGGMPDMGGMDFSNFDPSSMPGGGNFGGGREGGGSREGGGAPGGFGGGRP